MIVFLESSLRLIGTCARFNYDNSRIRIKTQKKSDKVLYSRISSLVLCNCSVLLQLFLAQVPNHPAHNNRTNRQYRHRSKTHFPNDFSTSEWHSAFLRCGQQPFLPNLLLPPVWRNTRLDSETI